MNQTVTRINVETACEVAEIDWEDILEDHQKDGSGRSGFGVMLDPRHGTAVSVGRFIGQLAIGMALASDDEDWSVATFPALLDAMTEDHLNYAKTVVYFPGWSIA